MLDLAINNALLVDPQSKTCRPGSVGIQDGRIQALSMGPLPAREVIDARGQAVSPGFIDVHAHVDGVTSYTDVNTCAKLSLLQGVTTLVSGNCGVSVSDVPAFFDHMDEGFPVEHAELIGHSSLRKQVGALNIYKPATPKQIEHMCCLAGHALCAGACGISFGLGYTPGTSMEEVYALARVAKRFGRVVTVDTRMQDNYDLNSLQEAIDINRVTGARVVVSHFVYQYGEGVIHEALEMMDRARAQGLDVWADSGMYVDWATTIGSECYRESFVYSHPSVLPSLVVATGEYTGQTLDAELYQELRAKHPNETVICRTGMEQSILPPFDYNFVMPSSDTAPYNPHEGHPQIAGSFAAFLSMVREKRNLSLPEAVYRATLLPAETFGFLKKGRLCEGADADLVVFDPERVRDQAAYVDKGDPDAPPEGIAHVVVQGQHVVDGGSARNDQCGRALRR